MNDAETWGSVLRASIEWISTESSPNAEYNKMRSN